MAVFTTKRYSLDPEDEQGQQPPHIAPSPADTPSVSAPTAPTPSAPITSSAPIGFDAAKWTDQTHQTDKYRAGRAAASGATRDQILATLGPGYRAMGTDSVVDDKGDIYDLFYDDDNVTGQRRPQWTWTGNIHGTGGSGGGSNASGGMDASGRSVAGPAPSVGGGSTFDDPATTEWETLLRQLVDRLNQPQPTWTPHQLELQQTQALDPLERQRQHTKQQVTQRLAQRGIGPGSGIFEQALMDVDRQFNQLRTTAQSGFATQAIQREDQLFGTNEQRAVNAVNMLKQIPQLADTRLQLANSVLTPSNPYQLLALQTQIEQQNRNQQLYEQQNQQQFLSNLVATLAPFFQ